MYSLIKDQKIDHTTNIEYIANSLLNSTVLIINGTPYAICEVEMYLKSETHLDLYSHATPDQLTYGKWAFHRYNTGSFRSGTFKGVDVSLGDGKNWYGILIRSMYHPSDGMIVGPCRVVHFILEAYGLTPDTAGLTWFVSGNSNVQSKFPEPLCVLNNRHNFVLANAIPANIQVWKGPRIGLSDKYPEFRERKYRFLVHPHLIKKDVRSLCKVEVQ
jgi:hypothetical protein